MDKEVDRIKQIVNDNINLIYKPTAQYYFSHEMVRQKYELDELLSVSTLALHKAATKFDKNKGCEFSTYAITLINFALMQFTRKDKWYFKRTVKKGIEKFETIDRISTATVISKEGNRDVTIEEALEDEEDHFQEIEDKQIVKMLLDSCPVREKAILEGYFFDRKSQAQLSREFKTSQSFISLVIRRNLKRFKTILEEEVDYAR